MAKQAFKKGSALLALARKKASELSIESKGVKMNDLILLIQEKEGHTSCFRKKEECQELACCWQLSCGAEMKK